ncbi:MAG: hypothetical protein R3A12_11900 [Ignavibacteria bacterium]
MEGDMVAYDEKYFFKIIKTSLPLLQKTERHPLFQVRKRSKTDYGDINEGSLVYNKNNELKLWQKDRKIL